MCQIGDVLLVIVFLFFLSFFSFPRWCEVITQVMQVRVEHIIGRKRGAVQLLESFSRAKSRCTVPILAATGEA